MLIGLLILVLIPTLIKIVNGHWTVGIGLAVSALIGAAILHFVPIYALVIYAFIALAIIAALVMAVVFAIEHIEKGANPIVARLLKTPENGDTSLAALLFAALGMYGFYSTVRRITTKKPKEVIEVAKPAVD